MSESDSRLRLRRKELLRGRVRVAGRSGIAGLSAPGSGTVVRGAGVGRGGRLRSSVSYNSSAEPRNSGLTGGFRGSGGLHEGRGSGGHLTKNKVGY